MARKSAFLCALLLPLLLCTVGIFVRDCVQKSTSDSVVAGKPSSLI